MVSTVDVKDMLSTAGVGTFAYAGSTTWGLYISKEPANPDRVVTIYETGGVSPNAKWPLDEISLQVRIRGAINGYLEAINKAQEVKDTLLGRPEETRNGTKYVGVLMLGDINFIHYDDSERPVFTTNWKIYKEPQSTAGYRAWP